MVERVTANQNKQTKTYFACVMKMTAVPQSLKAVKPYSSFRKYAVQYYTLSSTSPVIVTTAKEPIDSTDPTSVCLFVCLFL